MLRINFSILALAASAITLIIGPFGYAEWWKYVPMAGLILIALLLWTSNSFSNRRKKPDSLLTDPPKEESLADLGILEIRPKDPEESKNLHEDSEQTPSSDKPSGELPGGIQLNFFPESSPSNAEPILNTSKYDHPFDRQFLVPVLNGFRSALHAHAIGIITPGSNDYEYKILGTAGNGWGCSRGESFVLKCDLFEDSETTALHTLGADELKSNHLTYSLKPANITRLGVTKIGETNKLLLVDSIDQIGLFHPRTKELLITFGNAFRLLLYKEDPNRPRHEIVYEEMLRAKSEKTELAFALVVPQRAESMINAYGDFLEEIEKPLSDCLVRADPKSRVVKFGDLLFGIFIDGKFDQIEIWHDAVQHEIETQGGLLMGGIYIGIAIMTKDHHTAQDLHDDAKIALIEAYKDLERHTVII